MQNINWIGLYTVIRRETERTFRIGVQTLVTPWISATLYIFVFGFIVGRRIETIAGVPYINFVLPGILMMNVITSAFAHSSSSIYFARFLRQVEEILVAPFSHIEMIFGYIAGSIMRAFVIGVGILVIGTLFGAASMHHVGLFAIYVILIAMAFSLLGMIVGLWANGFEQLNILSTFVIMPLSFLGGVFYSITMLPENLKTITYANPFFYFIDGLRYSMIGVREANAWVGFGIILLTIAVLGGLVWHLFKIGWRIKL